jgi:hypothetical protein
MSASPKLVEKFYQSALFLKERMELDGWTWSWNYLREHARCALGARFTNTVSPEILTALRKAHPEIAHYEDGQQGNLFPPPDGFRQLGGGQ